MDGDAEGPRRKAHRGKRGNKKRGARKLHVESLTPGQLREAEALLSRQLDAAASARLPTKGLKDGRGRVRDDAGLLRPPAPIYKDTLARADSSGGSEGEEDDDLFDLGADSGVLALISSASAGQSRANSGSGPLPTSAAGGAGVGSAAGVRFAAGEVGSSSSGASSSATHLSPYELLAQTPLEGLCSLPNARAILLESAPPAMLVDLLLRASARLRDAAAGATSRGSSSEAPRRSRSRSRSGRSSAAAEIALDISAGSAVSNSAAAAEEGARAGADSLPAGAAAGRGSRSASIARRSASGGASASMPRRSPTPTRSSRLEGAAEGAAAAAAAASAAPASSAAAAAGSDGDGSAAGPRAAKRRRPDGP